MVADQHLSETKDGERLVIGGEDCLHLAVFTPKVRKYVMDTSMNLLH